MDTEKLKNLPEEKGGIACEISEEEITEAEKQKLWHDLVLEKETSTDPAYHMAELDAIHPEDLSDVEWFVLKNLDKLSEDEVNRYKREAYAAYEAEEPQRPYSSIVNFYALVVNKIIALESKDRLAELKKEHKQE